MLQLSKLASPQKLGHFAAFLGWAIFTAIATPLPAPAAGDDDNGQYYTVKVWGADEGLTEGSATDVAQTPEGYLWVGTLFGSVLRFDGTRFVSYNSANTPEFLLKWGIPRLMVDKRGTLWISMHDGGMTAWDAQGFHQAFPSIEQPERLMWSDSHRVIFAYANGKLLSGRLRGEQWDWQTMVPQNAQSHSQPCADAAGQVWFLRKNHEIGVWDGQEVKTLAPPPPLNGRQIKVLTADGQGRIWAGTDRGLFQWQDDHFEPRTPASGEGRLDVKRIVPTGASNLWVEANGRMRLLAGDKWAAESAGWEREMGDIDSFRFVQGDAEGGLWAAAGDLGLTHVLPDGTFHRLTTRDGLPSNTIRFAYQDRDGNTWTGYDRGGLVRVRRRLFKVIGKDEGLGDNLVNTVSQDDKGGIWIGMHNGEVGHYENGICTNLSLPATSRLQDSCVAADADGSVWIGAQGIGLVRRNPSGEMENVASIDELGGYPRLLLPGRDGRLWLATIWSIFTVNNKVLTATYTAHTVGEHPTALAEAKDGTIWAATLAGLILRWDGRNFIPLEPPEHSSLGRIWALWPAPDGSLWAGTEVGGLLHWKGGVFYRYTARDGLPSDSIIQVLGDAGGNLWLGTRAGLARIFGAALARHERGELNELPVSVYGAADGLLTIGSAIIFQPNCWHGKNGTLFFAMANSVASVDPAEVHINPVPPAVALEEVRADDQPVFPPRIGAILTESPPPADGTKSHVAIRVGPGRSDLEFRYTGLSLASPLRVRFKYKLEGLDNTWNEAGVERKVSYRRVPPGNYVFRVIACNSDGVFNEGGALLAVTVLPHFYQTAWFQIGAPAIGLAAMSLAVAAGMRARLRRRLEQVEREQELERERARIAQDLHDDLGAGLTEIGLLGGLLRDSQFAARREEALERIVRRCHDLVMGLDEIVWAVNPRNDSVNSLCAYLSRHAQSFLEPAAIRCRLEITEAQPDRPLTSEQRHHLFLAFEEALANIVKHSGAREARISISFDSNGGLLISIEDDGRGLPDVVAEGSDGLNNLRRRMAQIGGNCEIINRPAGGVAIRLNLILSS